MDDHQCIEAGIYSKALGIKNEFSNAVGYKVTRSNGILPQEASHRLVPLAMSLVIPEEFGHML